MTGIPRPTLILILVLTLVGILLGWNYVTHPFAKPNQTAQPELSAPSPTPSPTPEVSSLSPEQTIAQVLAYPVVVTASSSASVPSAGSLSVISATDLGWIAKYHPAVVTLFGAKISTVSAQLATAQIRAAYPDHSVLIAVDHEGGNTQRLSGPGFSILPSWHTLCAQNDVTVSQVLGTSLSEVKKAGFDIVLAPVVDVGSSPVLGSRICSTDPEIVAKNASNFISLSQERGLIPVIKHFPGIGSITRDLHSNFDQVTVRTQDAKVYQELLDRFPQLAVMVTHVGVTNQYGNIPCSLSADCVGELKENYPQSLVIADALEMKSAAQIPSKDHTAITSVTLSQRAVAAITAGDQILLFGQTVPEAQMTTVYQDLIKEYTSNATFKSEVDLAAMRVLALQKGIKSTQ